jgi:hypothetical protein
VHANVSRQTGVSRYLTVMHSADDGVNPAKIQSSTIPIVRMAYPLRLARKKLMPYIAAFSGHPQTDSVKPCSRQSRLVWRADAWAGVVAKPPGSIIVESASRAHADLVVLVPGDDRRWHQQYREHGGLATHADRLSLDPAGVQWAVNADLVMSAACVVLCGRRRTVSLRDERR